VVLTGAQANPSKDGLGVGSLDRFIPYDFTTATSTYVINVGDSINFRQITPHAHAVSIVPSGGPNPFLEGLFYEPLTSTLVESVQQFAPTPTPDAHGVITWNGTGYAVTGPFLLAGQNLTIKFTAEGNYALSCFFHETLGMVGTIKVVSAGTVTYPPNTSAPTGAAQSLAPFGFALIAVALISIMNWLL